MQSVRSFIQATRELAADLNRLRFGPPVGFVYNPLDYARASHERYLKQYLGRGRRVLFVGMNPGPFGMAQTGIPFGEVAAVRDWLGIRTAVGQPAPMHPRRPVLGFECPRSEVSGRRLWGLFADRFGTADRFFEEHFVHNYCPLLFLEGGPTGRNLTPDRLSGESMKRVELLCDRHLLRLIEWVGPQWAVGVGGFAEHRLRAVVRGEGPKIGRILHPSPSSPAANRDWAGTVTDQLTRMGAW